MLKCFTLFNFFCLFTFLLGIGFGGGPVLFTFRPTTTTIRDHSSAPLLAKTNSNGGNEDWGWSDRKVEKSSSKMTNDWEGWKEEDKCTRETTNNLTKKPSTKKKEKPKEGLLVDLDTKSDWNQKWEDDDAWADLNRTEK